MHEWALAESIITAALEAAEKEHLKTITEIKIGIGELQQIEQDIFEFALNEIIKAHGKKLKNVKISIETEESTLKCKICGHTWSFSDMMKKLNEEESEAIHFIPEVAFVHTRCPKCGSPDFEIITGRGVSIISIKGKR
ncbi:MAG: hydrogenase nickel incorporation protein HypA [Thermoplasmatales archaeon]|nr:hydrogenase nickel incorporation protein HypA [Thermoplasmatales archaeon]MCK5260887.1 hydrogenase nickel incorporation protein HypA [Thermoplasmatales archaeon]